MPNMTLALPDDMMREMRAHPEVNWSEVARRSLRKELERMHILDALLRGSELTEKDAIDLGRKVRRAASKRP